jgi:predicted nucleic acid-binding protein
VSVLLDTDILSNLLRRAPSTTLVRRLAATDPEDQFTSSITMGELVYGAERVPQRRDMLIERIERVLGTDLPVLPFDAEAARRYGTLRAELERAGTPIGEADLRIASIALTHELTVVTANIRHFERVPGLTVENWLEDADA